MTISIDGQVPTPIIGPGGIAPNVVGTAEVINEDLLSEDIKDGTLTPADFDRSYLELTGGTMSGGISVGSGLGSTTLDIGVIGSNTINLGAAGAGSGSLNFSQFNTTGDAIKLTKQGESAPRIAISPDSIRFGDGSENPLLTGFNRSSSTVIGVLANNQIAVAQDPTADNHLARKKYVNDQDALKVSKSGDTMSGDLTMNGNDVISVGTISSTLSTSSTRYQSLQFRLNGDGILNGGFGSSDSSMVRGALQSDSFYRFDITRFGTIRWGDGTSEPFNDIVLSRIADDTLQFNAGNQLRVQQDPVADDDLSRKKYVDDTVASGDALKVDIAGDDMTGPLTSTGNITAQNGNDSVAIIGNISTSVGLRSGIDISNFIDPGSHNLYAFSSSTMATDSKLRIVGSGTDNVFISTSGTVSMTGLQAGANVFGLSSQFTTFFSASVNGESSPRMSFAGNRITMDDGTGGNTASIQYVGAKTLELIAGAQLRTTADPSTDDDLARKVYVDAHAVDNKSSIVQSTSDTVNWTERVRDVLAATATAGRYRVGAEMTWRGTNGNSAIEIEVVQDPDGAATVLGSIELKTSDNSADINQIEHIFGYLDLPASPSVALRTFAIRFRKGAGPGSVASSTGAVEIWRVKD